MAEDFGKALKEHGCEAAARKVRWRTHRSILFKATSPQDPVGRLMLDFVHKHAR
jgi:hypothetical protein